MKKTKILAIIGIFVLFLFSCNNTPPPSPPPPPPPPPAPPAPPAPPPPPAPAPQESFPLPLTALIMDRVTLSRDIEEYRFFISGEIWLQYDVIERSWELNQNSRAARETGRLSSQRIKIDHLAEGEIISHRSTLDDIILEVRFLGNNPNIPDIVLEFFAKRGDSDAFFYLRYFGPEFTSTDSPRHIYERHINERGTLYIDGREYRVTLYAITHPFLSILYEYSYQETIEQYHVSPGIRVQSTRTR